MSRKTIIGIMGPGEGAHELELQYAYELGTLIAQQGWVLLTGGRGVGVMEAANRAAKMAGGLTVGILPGNNHQGISEMVDIPILTDLGNARNNINVLSSDVVIACGMGIGTLSEIALALKNHRQLVLICQTPATGNFIQSLAPHQVWCSDTPVEAIGIVKQLLSKNG